MSKIFYYDVESTGLNHWRHGVHQIAGIMEIDGEVVGEIKLDLQPYKDAVIVEESVLMSGKTLEDLKNSMPFEKAYKELTDFFLKKYCNKFDKKDKIHLAGYNNASFDNHFLRAFFVQNGDKYFNSWFWIDSIDVMVLASHLLMDMRAEMKDFKLSTVAATLGIKVDESKLHDAMYDIILTKAVYDKLKNRRK